MEHSDEIYVSSYEQDEELDALIANEQQLRDELLEEALELMKEEAE